MAKRLRTRALAQPHPTNIDGFPVAFEELDLPLSSLDATKQDTYHNHHWFYTRREMGQLALTQTLRDLAAYQTVTAKDIHSVYHMLYLPPKLPSPRRMMDRVDKAFTTGELLRYGSASLPTYGRISGAIYAACLDDYARMN